MDFFIGQNMKNPIKLYNVYERAKHIFVKPSLRIYFGRWSKDPNLPVWRSRECLWPFRNFKRNNSYYPNSCVSVKVGEKTYPNYKYKIPVYEWSYHKLPRRISPYRRVWNRNIRKKLKRWHLSWITPGFVVPKWLEFHVFNWELGWKTKYDDYRYEFPPQFTIVMFGISLSFTLHSPVEKECDDHYWESILNYCASKGKTEEERLRDAIQYTGVWTILTDNTSYFGTSPKYIKKEYLDTYYKITSDLKKHEFKNKSFLSQE